MKIALLIPFLWLGVCTLHGQEIIDAVKSGDFEKVKILIENNPEAVKQTDPDARTPLHWAARGTNLEIFKFLAEKGADPNALDNYGNAPIHSVVVRGNLSAVNILLDKGANIHIATADRNTPLHLAAQAGKAEVVRLLVERGADIERTNGYQRTPLVLAARERGGPAVIEALLDLGAKVDASDYSGETALTLAAWRGTTDVVSLLLKRGAAVPVTGEKGQMLLSRSVAKALPELFNRMVKDGADLSIEQKGKTLLHSAAEGGSAPIVEVLLSKNLDINRKDELGWSPLLYAVDAGKYEVIDLLLSNGADRQCRTSIGQSAFNIAEDDTDQPMMEFLRARQFDISPPKFPELQGPYLGQKPPGRISEVFAPGIVSGHYSLHGNVSFSPDGKEVFWNRMEGKAMHSRLENGHWTYPRRASFGGVPLEDSPFYHPDGTKLYDMAWRLYPGGRDTRKENIWVWNKSADGWTNPQPLDSIINVLPQHWQFSLDRAGNLYFSTSILGSAGGDIYESKLLNGKYSAPENLGPAINSPAEDGFPFISPDGSFLLFCRNRDIYVSFRLKDGLWGQSKPLGPEVNTPGAELFPVISPDGKYLFYFGSGYGVRWIDASVIKD